MNYNKDSFYRTVSLAAVFWTTVSMSAYTPHETGSRTTASGAKAREGYTCAANFVPMGSVIIYEGHKYVVEDRMNPKYNRHVDIFMESHKKAIQFGRKEATVQVITPNDKHTKLPKDDKKRKHNNKNKDKKKEEIAAAPAKENKITIQKKQPSRSPNAPVVLKPQKKP